MRLKRRMKATKDFGVEQIALFLIVASAGMFIEKHLTQFSMTRAREFLLLCWGGYGRP